VQEYSRSYRLPGVLPTSGQHPPGHYIAELYALDQKLDLEPEANRADLLKPMDGRVIGKATYVM